MDPTPDERHLQYDDIDRAVETIREHVSDQISGDLIDVLAFVKRSPLWAQSDPELREHWNDTVVDLVRELGFALENYDDDDALRWADMATRRLDDILHRLPIALFYDEEIRAHQRAASTLRDRIQSTVDARAIRDLAGEARQTQMRIAEAAGTVSSASMAIPFRKHAQREGRASLVFRFLSAGALVTAVILAALLPHRTGDWVEFAYRAATLAGMAGLSAYFARIAAQHRRVYDWARSLEVQLVSFPAFVQSVPEDQREDINRMFARRVLANPPERGVETAEDVPSGQVLDLVTAALKRTP